MTKKKKGPVLPAELPEHLVELPGRDGGMSRSKLARKGLGHGSLRVVQTTDRTQRGGFQLVGQFLPGAEAELRTAEVVAQQHPDRDWRIGIVTAAGAIAWLTDWISSTRMPSVRRAAERAITDRGGALSEVVEGLRSEAAAAQAELDAALNAVATYEADAAQAKKDGVWIETLEGKEAVVAGKRKEAGRARERLDREESALQELLASDEPETGSEETAAADAGLATELRELADGIENGDVPEGRGAELARRLTKRFAAERTA